MIIDPDHPSSKMDDREKLPSRQATPNPTSSLSQSAAPQPLRIKKQSIKRKPVPDHKLPPAAKQTAELHFDLEPKPEEVGLKRQLTQEVPRSLVAGGPARAQAQKATEFAQSNPSHYDFRRHDEDEVSPIGSLAASELPLGTLEVSLIGSSATFELEAETSTTISLKDATLPPIELPATLSIPDYDGSSYRSSWDEHITELPENWSWVGSDKSSEAGARDDDLFQHLLLAQSRDSSAGARPGWESYQEQTPLSF